MLEPQDRRLLLESLRPPVGYALDCAVGTTFSLDLLTLLTAPLAFTFFDWQHRGDQAANDPLAWDPLALLEAVRQNADRIGIFCQAGQIAIPKPNQLLYTYLEQSVLEVTAPKEHGVFHPKVWVLRYTTDEGPVCYRFLCLSRNLTFDRSWDTVLIMDGELIDRKNAFATNHPLADFVATLPKITLRPVPERMQASVDLIQNELRRVHFEPPEGFESATFWPLGLRGSNAWPFTGRVDRMMVVSPFVSENCLSRLAENGKQHVLVSRSESLSSLDGPRCLAQFDRVYTLDDAANGETPDDEDLPVNDETPPTGLHAKLYVADEGWDARIWTGSANATDAAFNGNVEFLVELRGKRAHCGVEAILRQTEGKTGLIDLLNEFKRTAEVVPIDLDQLKLDRLTEDARRILVKARLIARVHPLGEGQEFNLQLYQREKTTPKFAAGIKVRTWPITLPNGAAVEVNPTSAEIIADFGQVSFEAITSFHAFEVVATNNEKSSTSRFVLNLPLEGAPENRKDGILRYLLRDRHQVLRFLLFLLAEDYADARDLLSANGQGQNGKPRNGTIGSAYPLFEPLVRALDRNPEKLDQIAQVIESLAKNTDGQQLLPEGFDQLWQPIWTARQRLRS